MKDILPPRFTEAAFRRYEQVIKHALEVAPSDFQIDCSTVFHLSTETVVNRLRDAMRSLHIHRWTTSIDMVKFNELYPRLQVCRENGLAIIRTRLASSTKPTSPSNITTTPIPLDGTAEQRKQAVLGAILLATTANKTLGLCGLGGLRLLCVSLPFVTSLVETHNLSSDLAIIPDGNDIILL